LALLGVVLAATLLVGSLLLRDFRSHPAGFPEPSPSHGLRMDESATNRGEARSRWASQNRIGGTR
jgi:hypothetical protein